MPEKDKTGPLGEGQLTGRGFGPCGQGLTNRRGFGRRFEQGQTMALDKEDQKKILEAQKTEIEKKLSELG